MIGDMPTCLEGQTPASGKSPLVDDESVGPEEEPDMILQLETRPISHEQLVIKVEGIYAGLVTVETKCIDIDEEQSAAAQEKNPSKKGSIKE
jgi:hypothetical protein